MDFLAMLALKEANQIRREFDQELDALKYNIYQLELERYYDGKISPKQAMIFDGFADSNLADTVRTTASIVPASHWVQNGAGAKQSWYYSKENKFSVAFNNAKIWLTRAISVATSLAVTAAKGATVIKPANPANFLTTDTIEIISGSARHRAKIISSDGVNWTIDVALPADFAAASNVHRVDAFPAVFLGAEGEAESFVTPTFQYSATNADGNSEDVYYYQKPTNATRVTVRILLDRAVVYNVNLLTANQSNAETDLTGFSSFSTNNRHTFARSTYLPWEGTGSAKITSTDTVNATLSINTGALKTTVAGGQSYAFSAYARTDGAFANMTARATIFWYDANDQVISYVQSPAAAPPNNSWNRYSVVATAPANAAKCYCDISFFNVAPNVGVWADGLQLEQNAGTTAWKLGGTQVEILPKVARWGCSLGV